APALAGAQLRRFLGAAPAARLGRFRVSARTPRRGERPARLVRRQSRGPAAARCLAALPARHPLRPLRRRRLGALGLDPAQLHSDAAAALRPLALDRPAAAPAPPRLTTAAGERRLKARRQRCSTSAGAQPSGTWRVARVLTAPLSSLGAALQQCAGAHTRITGKGETE